MNNQVTSFDELSSLIKAGRQLYFDLAYYETRQEILSVNFEKNILLVSDSKDIFDPKGKNYAEFKITTSLNLYWIYTTKE